MRAPDVRLEGGTVLTLVDGAPIGEPGFVDILGDRIVANGRQAARAVMARL